MISRRNGSGRDVASECAHAAAYVDRAVNSNSLPRAVKGNIQAQAEEDVPTTKAVVLVIDDEEIVRSVTQRILERFGFQVLLANNGIAGLELFQAHAPMISCVLLDLSMPRLNGEDLYYELYRLNPDMRIILMSGYTEEELIHRFQGVHHPVFLVKPFTAQDLHTKVRQVIDA